MFIHPAIASEIARDRHHDFVARADRYRLSRRVNHPTILSALSHFRASSIRWQHLADHVSQDASDEGAIVVDQGPHPVA